jgi:hypothetical protein
MREESGLPLLELPSVVRRRFDVAALETLAAAVAGQLLAGRGSAG